MRSLDLTAIEVDAGPRSLALLDVIDSWAAQVLRMFRESVDRPGPGEDVWGADDLVGALFARDRIEQAIQKLDADVRPLPTLAVADELFRLFTEPDEEELLLEVGMAVPRELWYWRRIPRAGPVPEDLREWRRRRLGGKGVA